ncbi:MAG: mannitol dehydrogenase family protein, partial [Pseudomonadota bacterium]
YRLRDPREEELMQAFDDGSNNALKIVENFLAISSLFPEALIQSETWKNEVGYHLKSMIEQGVYASIQPMLR